MVFKMRSFSGPFFRRFTPSFVLSVSILAGGTVGQDTNYANGNVAPTATADNGILIGKSTSLPDGLGRVNQFLGVPFAQSPPERFSPPQTPPRASAPTNATSWKAACIQQFTCMFPTKILVDVPAELC